MAHLNFADVGVLQTVRDQYEEAKTISQIPFGIKTPLELSYDSNMFTTNDTIKTQISDNLRNLISTNYGERVGIVDFGANLNQLVSDYASKESFDSEAMARIKTSVKKWMPYVELVGYESAVNREQSQNIGTITIFIVYSVSVLNILENMVRVDLKVM
jgi:phage baseplate assembly protein W